MRKIWFSFFLVVMCLGFNSYAQPQGENDQGMPPQDSNSAQGQGVGRGGNGGMPPIPQEAIAACQGKAEGDACEIEMKAPPQGGKGPKGQGQMGQGQGKGQGGQGQGGQGQGMPPQNGNSTSQNMGQGEGKGPQGKMMGVCGYTPDKKFFACKPNGRGPGKQGMPPQNSNGVQQDAGPNQQQGQGDDMPPPMDGGQPQAQN